jgi:putative transposase
VRKRQRRFVGFDEKILALYSRGLSTRDISAHLQEIYGVNVSRDLISRVTDAVMDDVREWGKRPLEDIYPIVFLDCMVLKIREGATVQRRALYPSPWASRSMVTATCSACGSRRPRAQSSGCRSSTT